MVYANVNSIIIYALYKILLHTIQIMLIRIHNTNIMKLDMQSIV